MNITPAWIIESIIPLVTLLLFLAGLGLAYWRMLRARRGAQQEELERLDETRCTLEALLRQSLGGLVTAAEQSQGAGGGAVKKSMVFTELLRILPEDLRTAFSAETLSAWIETALDEVRPLWAAEE